MIHNRSSSRVVSHPLLLAVLALLFAAFTAPIVSADPTPTPLTPGIPVEGSVEGDSYAYFSLAIPNDNEDSVTFTTTPIDNGDPDLFCSTVDELPDLDNHEKSAIGWGADTITFKFDELPTEADAKVYCSVRGWISTEFVIVGFFGDAIVALRDGVPQSGDLNADEENYFSFQLDVSDPEDVTGDLTFSATAFAGQLHFFVSNNSEIPDPEDTESFQWRSRALHTGEALVIFPNDPSWPQDGRFTLSVIAVEDGTSFSLVASTNDTNTLLRDNLPQQGRVSGSGMDYYKTVVTGENCSLTVTVTPTAGDPDLYMAGPSSPDTVHPRPEDYERRAIGLGADSIVYSPAPAGTYHIGVHAYWSEASFVIVSRTSGCNRNNDTQFILPGVPQNGHLEQLESAFYKLPVRGNVSLVTISVTRDFGDPDLYVTTNGEKPSLTNYQFRSVNWGEDLINIADSDEHFCTDCEYWIMVWAGSNTSYTLTGSTSNSIAVLREGVPLRSRVEADSYTYFRFAHSDWGRPITFSVTDLGSGDPDLFISTSNPNPSAEDHTWSSMNLAADSVTIPDSDADYCNLCTYFVGVYGYSEPATFTVLVTYDEIVRLADGVPQSASVLQGATRYFLLETNQDASDITFSVTNRVGVTNLFINTCPNPSSGAENCVKPVPDDTDSYHWVVYGINGDRSHRIPPSDEFACANSGCVYVVAVEATSDSDFTILGRSAAATIPLRNGVPVEGYNTASTWQYYSYEVDSEDRNLAFVVTPVTGDPDIYISLSHPRPNTTHHDKSGVRWGEDVVDFIPANVSQYWIGVVAYTDTSYTLTALETPASGGGNGTVIQLQDGKPQTGLVPTGEYRYFSFDSPANASDLTFTVTRRFGDPDLYIQNDTTLPTRDNYRWSSNSANDDLVRILQPVPGRYIAGVYGYVTASFSITASTGVTTLQDSVPLRGELATGEYRYYRLYVNDLEKDLVVTVTPFSGDPDLYMSRESSLAPGELPNMTNWEWASQSYLGDSITVPHTDEKFEEGAYIVGVYSYIASSYSIVYSASGVSTLQDGTPQAGSVARKAFRYYRLLGAEHDRLTISVTPMTGTPHLYVNSGPVADVKQPTLGNHQRSANGHTGNEIVYLSSDDDFCRKSEDTEEEDCMYWIGVYGDEASNFSVIATTDQKSIALRDGIPVTDQTAADSYAYFRFQVTTPGQSLIITVTPLTGDPDIYADDEHVFPNETNAKWVARGNGADALSIPDCEVGFYYIGIYGYTNTTFTLTAMSWVQESNRTLQLIDGVPQRGAIPEKGWMYYRMDLWSDVGTGGDPEGFEEVSFMLSKLVGDPDIYITNDGELPSLEHWQWRSSTWGPDEVTIKKPEDGVYLVGVYGFTATTYTILGATTWSSRTLMTGVPFTESLETGKYHYFKFFVDSDDSDLTVTVTALDGDPDLFMSAVHFHPNHTHSEWQGQGYLEDSITVPSQDLQRIPYYISVYAYRNATYTIVANLNSTVTLQNGIPQSGYLPARDSAAYYQIQVPEDYPDLSVYLSPLTGSFYLYLSHTQKPVYNDPDSYQWSSFDSTGQQQIILRRGEPGFCNNCTRFYVMVYSVARGPATFNVVGSTTENGLITLIDGIPQRRQVAEGAWEYYRFNLGNPTAALILSVTPISGDPDMYVSAITHRPGKDNYTWVSAGWGEDMIHIDYTDPDYVTGDYYIGITGFEATTYTIAAQVVDLSGKNDTSTVHLFNGQPQIGFLQQSGENRYFQFVVERSALAALAEDDGEEIIIAAVPRYGDPDLYVYIGEDPHATPDNAQWSSRNWGRDAVTIRPEDDAFCTDNVCRYKVTVNSFTPSLFTITATRGASIRLLEMGVPFRDEVQESEYRYFQLQVNRVSHPLVIAATVLSSEHELGDPDMYISHEDSGIHYPNQTHHDWSESHFGSDIFSHPNPKPGFYYVSIRGYRPTTFSLTAWNGPITLLPGEPQKGVVTGDSSALFILAVNRDEEDEEAGDLEFTLLLDNIGGMEVDMWLCNDASAEEGGDDEHDGCTDPGPEEFQWSNRNASQSGIPNLITVPRSDPGFCESCLYYLRVTSKTRSAFTLNAGFNGDLRTLLGGKPVTLHTEAESYRYYRARVDPGLRQDIFLSSTLFTGEIVMVASFQVVKPHLDSDPDKIWISDRVTAGAVHLTLNHEDPRFRTEAPLFVSVYSVSESRLSLSLTTGHLQLLDGQPILGVVPKRPEDPDTSPYHGAQFFFQNQVPNHTRASDIAITINRRTYDSGDIVSLGPDSHTLSFRDSEPEIRALQAETPLSVFVSTSESNQTNPGPDDYQWNVRLADGTDLATLLLPTDDPKFCRTCTYFVGVYGAEGSQFSIKIATADSYVMLLEGEKDHSSVRPERYRYFGMFVENADNFTAIVEPCVGSVAIYGSQDNYRPSKERHTWANEAEGSVLRITNADGNITDSTFYLAVRGRHRNSEFLIHAHTRVRPAVDPIPGNVGALSTTTNEVGAVRLAFTAARPASGGDGDGDGDEDGDGGVGAGKAKELRYTVYQRRLEGHSPEEEGAVMFTECGLKRGASIAGRMNSSATSGTLTYTVRNLEPGAYYTFNIVADDPSADSRGGLGIYRSTPGIQVLSEADVGGGGGGVDAGLVAGIAIPVLLLGLLCVGVLWHRNRKLTRAAKDIQMQDVPDTAMRKAVRDPSETGGSQAKKYHQLLADEDSFVSDEAHGYNPPVGSDGSLNDDTADVSNV